jgi:hypothetical protein
MLAALLAPYVRRRRPPQSAVILLICIIVSPVMLLALAALPLAFWGESLWSASAGIAGGGPQRIWQDWYFHGVLIDMLGQGGLHPVHDLRGVGLPSRPITISAMAWWGGCRRLAAPVALIWPSSSGGLGMLLLLAAASEWVFRLRPERPWLALALPLTLFWPDAAGLGRTGFPGLTALAADVSPAACMGARWPCCWRAGCMAGSRIGSTPVSSLLVLLAGLAVAMLFRRRSFCWLGHCCCTGGR